MRIAEQNLLFRQLIFKIITMKKILFTLSFLFCLTFVYGQQYRVSDDISTLKIIVIKNAGNDTFNISKVGTKLSITGNSKRVVIKDLTNLTFDIHKDSCQSPSVSTADSLRNAIKNMLNAVTLVTLVTDSVIVVDAASKTNQLIQTSRLDSIIKYEKVNRDTTANGNESLRSIDSKITAVNTGAVVVSSSALPANASKEDGGSLDSIYTKLNSQDLKLGQIESNTSGMRSDVADSLGKVIANQLPDNHDVTISNASLAVTGTFYQATQPVSAASLPLPTNASKEDGGSLDSIYTNITTSATTIVNGLDTITTKQSGAWNIVTKADTTYSATLDTANVSTSSYTILAANTSRRGATLYNTSSVVCFVSLKSVATNLPYTVKLSQDDYYTLPKEYTGIVTGITDSGTAIISSTEW